MSAEIKDLLSPFVRGPHALPGIWRHMLPEDLAWLELPDESKTDCANCNMVACGRYESVTRCCTYYPETANFMLGLGLFDDEAGRAVGELVEAGRVTPYGLVPSPQKYLEVMSLYADDRFGRRAEMACPVLDTKTGSCRIHAVRSSVCSTFFCRNDAREQGAEFWDQLQAMVAQVESALSQWCMDELGLAHAAYVRTLDEAAQDLPALSDPGSSAWSEAALAMMWGSWRGRELEFLRGCAELVAQHAEQLFDIARDQPAREALVYEARLRAFVPERDRHEAHVLATHNSERRPIDDDWHMVQVRAKKLWALPFGEAPVVLSPETRLADNPRDDAWSRHVAQPHMVETRNAQGQRVREFIDAQQLALLQLFVAPQRLGEALLERPEIRAVDGARKFLAQCLRCGVLTTGR